MLEVWIKSMSVSIANMTVKHFSWTSDYEAVPSVKLVCAVPFSELPNALQGTVCGGACGAVSDQVLEHSASERSVWSFHRKARREKEYQWVLVRIACVCRSDPKQALRKNLWRARDGSDSENVSGMSKQADRDCDWCVEKEAQCVVCIRVFMCNVDTSIMEGMCMVMDPLRHCILRLWEMNFEHNHFSYFQCTPKCLYGHFKETLSWNWLLQRYQR